MVPDNPLDVLAQFSGTSDVDKVAELTREYALDRPIFPDQYVVFLRQMLTLDLHLPDKNTGWIIRHQIRLSYTKEFKTMLSKVRNDRFLHHQIAGQAV
jgi:hypothetical protein